VRSRGVEGEGWRVRGAGLAVSGLFPVYGFIGENGGVLRRGTARREGGALKTTIHLYQRERERERERESKYHAKGGRFRGYFYYIFLFGP
jgi:hypothetical protein